VRSLARDHGGDVIRGIFLDRDSRAFYDSIPPVSRVCRGVQCGNLLIDLACSKLEDFSQQVQVKRYLRQAASGKRSVH